MNKELPNLRTNIAAWAVPIEQIPAVTEAMLDQLPPEEYDPKALAEARQRIRRWKSEIAMGGTPEVLRRACRSLPPHALRVLRACHPSFAVLRAGDGDVEEPVAEVFLGIAFARLAEDGGDGVLAGKGLRLGELLKGFGDGFVEAASEAFEHGADLFFDEGAEVVALDGVRDALVDEGFGVGFFDIDAFAGLLAAVGYLELNERGSSATSVSLRSLNGQLFQE